MINKQRGKYEKNQRTSFDVIIGKKITVAVISDENDEWGDEAKRMISDLYKFKFGLPSKIIRMKSKAILTKSLRLNLIIFEYLLIKDENGKVKDLA